MGSVKKAGDILSLLFKEHFDPVSLEKGRISAELFSSWATATREANISVAADHSRVRELKHKVLVIEAEHPGWVQILQTKQSHLLKIVQQKYPELSIHGISFCLSREPISSLPVVELPETLIEEERIDSSISSPPKSLHEPIKNFKKLIEKRNRAQGIR